MADGPVTIGGRRLRLIALAGHSAADLALLDEATGTLIAGDLVFHDRAPATPHAHLPTWRASLSALEAIPHKVLVPGHGQAMTGADFETYRRAFAALLACAASEKPKEDCIGGWIADLGKLLPEVEHAFTRALLDYYLDNHLRGDPERTAKLCAPA